MERIADWRGDADCVADLGHRLRDGGLPADRLALFRRTLHPEILGRATAWAPGRPVEIFDRDHGIDLSIQFAGSPLDLAMTRGLPLRLQPAEFERSFWRWADPFRGLGLAELVIHPLRSGATLAVGTCRPGGFAPAEMTLLVRLAERRRAAGAAGISCEDT